MKKRVFLLAAALACVLFNVQASPAEDAPEGAVAQEEMKDYKIVEHDTLWDISKRHLSDPFRWPELWKMNPYIKNPHLIFPGDTVRLSPSGPAEPARAAEPAKPAEPAGAMEVKAAPEEAAPVAAAEAPAEAQPQPLIEAAEVVKETAAPAAIVTSPEPLKETPRPAAKALEVISLEPEEARVEVLEPEVQPAPAGAAAPETAGPAASAAEPFKVLARKFISNSIERRGFLSPKELKGSGAVIGTKEKKVLLNKGDTVSIVLNEQTALKPGERYSIFTVDKEVEHPVTGKGLGYLVDVLGSLTVIKTNGFIEGTIDNSYKDIPSGARLMAFREPVREIVFTDAPSGVEGVIVASMEGKEQIQAGDVVFIDRGLRDGLKTGNVMHIYRDSGKAADPRSGRGKIKLPHMDVGDIVVVEAGEEASVCLVIKSLNAVNRGDKVSTTELY